VISQDDGDSCFLWICFEDTHIISGGTEHKLCCWGVASWPGFSLSFSLSPIISLAIFLLLQFFFPVKGATNMMMGGRYATKQLHLNPIKAVVQLRPSMKYIDDADVAKKKQNREAGITDGDDEEMVEAEASESKSELTLLQVCISDLFTWRLGLNVSGDHVDVVTNVLGFVAIGFDRGKCMLLL
jgi:hypothetical protein